MLASTKQIRLTIEDETVSTTEGLRNLRRNASRAAVDTELVIRDIEGTATLATSLLYIQHDLCSCRGRCFQPLFSVDSKPAAECAATFRAIVSTCGFLQNRAVSAKRRNQRGKSTYTLHLTLWPCNSCIVFRMTRSPCTCRSTTLPLAERSL